MSNACHQVSGHRHIVSKYTIDIGVDISATYM